MLRFAPAGLSFAGAVLLALCAGNQARLISDAPSARSPEAAASALPFLFFAGSAGVLAYAGAVSISDTVARRNS